MTKYGRSYSVPVFHVADADEEQRNVMDTVFQTLHESEIDFVIVDRNRSGEIEMYTSGCFCEAEINQIEEEIREYYEAE